MIYYIAAFVIYYLCLGFAFLKVGNTQNFFLLAMLPLVLLVILRGEVGTDTASYVSIVNQIKDTGTAAFIEPAFSYLIRALFYVTDAPLLILALVALISTSILINASASTDRALYIFAFCIIPIFYLDMTMNGLRYGLSFSCAMYAVSKFYQRRTLLSNVWGVVAVLFHASGLLLFFVIALCAETKDEFKRWLALIALLILAVLIQLYFPNLVKYLTPDMSHVLSTNLEAKYELYQQLKSPSWFSGLAPLVMSLALLFILQHGNRENPLLDARHAYILFALISLTFVIAKFSYAGLGLQFVVLFAMLLMMQFTPQSEIKATDGATPYL